MILNVDKPIHTNTLSLRVSWEKFGIIYFVFLFYFVASEIGKDNIHNSVIDNPPSPPPPISILGKTWLKMCIDSSFLSSLNLGNCFNCVNRATKSASCNTFKLLYILILSTSLWCVS